ncbi:MAG TPA: zinc-binding alcohol dehydrogenase family protein [Streptosporangiaceae bacterium]|nr:zinc-binding alcohol dehydrogenase family protein [Streptosporangiaceae bacterium]
MRVTAARLVRHGQPLELQELELGEPGDEEVLLEVAYGGVNPTDMHGAQGQTARDGPVPRTLGTEGSGTVDGRPVLVRGFGIGTMRDGLWATAAIVPRAALIDLPDGVNMPQAATMGVAGATAWRTVTELAQVTADDTVLVLGASGGVGSIVVSMAHGIGATVAGQTGSESKRDWISRIGADYAVVSDAVGLTEALVDLPPTVVFDGLGGEFTGAAIEAMQPKGRLVLFGTSAGLTGQLPLRQLYRKGITMHGYAGLLASNQAITAAVQEALQALAAGQFSVPIDSELPLDQVNVAFDLIKQRSVHGNLVLDTRI